MYNVICVMLDSLRQDHVGAYGNDWIRTPNLDAFAAESVVFDNAYPEGLPTVPVRTALFTGQHTLPFRPWQPLTGEDITAAEILSDHNFTTALITDTYHLAKAGYNFHRGFNVFRWIRGQEGDSYESGPRRANLHGFVKEEMIGHRIVNVLDQYLRNTAGFESEEDWFAGQTFSESMRWLEGSHKMTPFFLWVDSFDPHEPWDPPPNYEGLYADPGYEGPKIIHPMNGPVDWMSDEELQHVRDLYAAEVTYVDTWFGKFMNQVRELDLLDDTLIVVLSDHGHPHGDHGTILKSPQNMYNELIRLVFMVRLPGGDHAGERSDALVYNMDLLPTMLDLLGLERETQAMHGRSFMPLLTGEQAEFRDHIICGYHQAPHRVIRDKQWSLIVRPEGEDDELYDLANDPGEQTNLIAEHREKARKLAAHLGVTFQSRGAPIPELQERYEYEGTAIR